MSKTKVWTNKPHSNHRKIPTAKTVQITTTLKKITTKGTLKTQVKASSQEIDTMTVIMMAQTKPTTWKTITEMLKTKNNIIASIWKDAEEKKRVTTKLLTCIIWSLQNIRMTQINIDLA